MAISAVSLPSDPHLRRWMLFVDGENFVIQAQNYAKEFGFTLIEGDFYECNVFVWIPGYPATQELTDTPKTPVHVQRHAIRAFYYTSVVGDEKKITNIRRALHTLGFNPYVFKKPSQTRKTKGVDITLAKDILSNAYSDNFDVAVIIAGDGDYIPLVEEIKRIGKVAYIAFFLDKRFGWNEELGLASDREFDIGRSFKSRWVDHKNGQMDG